MRNCGCSGRQQEPAQPVNVPAMFACRQSVPDILCTLGATINNMQNCFKPEVVAMMNHLSCCGFAVDTDKNKMWYNGVQYELNRSSDCIKSVCVSNVTIIQQPTYEEITADRNTPALPQYAYKYDVTYVYADGSCNQVTGVTTGGIAIFSSKGSYSCTIDGVLDIQPNYTGNDKVTVVTGYLEIHGIKVQFDPAIVRQPSAQVVHKYQYEDIEATPKVIFNDGSAEGLVVTNGAMLVPSTGGVISLSCYHERENELREIVQIDGPVQKRRYYDGNVVVTEDVTDGLITRYYRVGEDGETASDVIGTFSIGPNMKEEEVVHTFRLVVTNENADDAYKQKEWTFTVVQAKSDYQTVLENIKVSFDPLGDNISFGEDGGTANFALSITADEVEYVNGVAQSRRENVPLSPSQLSEFGLVWSFDDTDKTEYTNSLTASFPVERNSSDDDEMHTVSVNGNINGVPVQKTWTINVEKHTEDEIHYSNLAVVVEPASNIELTANTGNQNVVFTITRISATKQAIDKNGNVVSSDEIVLTGDELSNAAAYDVSWTWNDGKNKTSDVAYNTSFDTTNSTRTVIATDIELSVTIGKNTAAVPASTTVERRVIVGAKAAETTKAFENVQVTLASDSAHGSITKNVNGGDVVYKIDDIKVDEVTYVDGVKSGSTTLSLKAGTLPAYAIEWSVNDNVEGHDNNFTVNVGQNATRADVVYNVKLKVTVDNNPSLVKEITSTITQGYEYEEVSWGDISRVLVTPTTIEKTFKNFEDNKTETLTSSFVLTVYQNQTVVNGSSESGKNTVTKEVQLTYDDFTFTASSNRTDTATVSGSDITIKKNNGTLDNRAIVTITVTTDVEHDSKSKNVTIDVWSRKADNSDIKTTFSTPTFTLGSSVDTNYLMAKGDTVTFYIEDFKQTYHTNIDSTERDVSGNDFTIKSVKVDGVDVTSQITKNGTQFTYTVEGNETFADVTRAMVVTIEANGKDGSQNKTLKTLADTVNDPTLSYQLAPATAGTRTPTITVTRGSNGNSITSKIKNAKYTLTGAPDGVTINESTGVISFAANDNTSQRNLGTVTVTFNIDGYSEQLSATTTPKQSGKAPGAYLYSTTSTSTAEKLSKASLSENTECKFESELSYSTSNTRTWITKDKIKEIFVVFDKTKSLTIQIGEETYTATQVGTLTESSNALDAAYIWRLKADFGYIANDYTFTFR